PLPRLSSRAHLPSLPPRRSSDLSAAYTPLAWWGRETTRMRLGTSVIQLSARTPTACAMAALTLDHLSGGRHILGLGVSGPQVVEGWYGQRFPKPLARTREYIEDRKSTRLNSSHVKISYAVFCLKKKKENY